MFCFHGSCELNVPRPSNTVRARHACMHAGRACGHLFEIDFIDFMDWRAKYTDMTAAECSPRPMRGYLHISRFTCIHTHTHRDGQRP